MLNLIRWSFEQRILQQGRSICTYLWRQGWGLDACRRCSIWVSYHDNFHDFCILEVKYFSFLLCGVFSYSIPMFWLQDVYFLLQEIENNEKIRSSRNWIMLVVKPITNLAMERLRRGHEHESLYQENFIYMGSSKKKGVKWWIWMCKHFLIFSYPWENIMVFFRDSCSNHV